jgi:hypothetical protein
MLARWLAGLGSLAPRRIPADPAGAHSGPLASGATDPKVGPLMGCLSTVRSDPRNGAESLCRICTAAPAFGVTSRRC